MRIGVDATSLPPRKAGVGTYVRGLLEGAGRLVSDHTFVVFIKDSDRRYLGEGSGRISFRCVRGVHSRLRRLAWEQGLLPRLARHIRLDVLHCPHYTMPLALRGVRAVVSILDMTFFLLPGKHVRSKAWYFRKMIPFSLRKADRLLSISHHTKADLCRLFPLDTNRVDVTPLGVDERYRQRVSDAELSRSLSRYGLTPGYLLSVGTLEPRKNIDGLLRAFAHACEKGLISTNLVVVGQEGWAGSKVHALHRSLGLEKRVSLVGYVEDEDMPAVYQGARAFVYPSLYEGFGIPVIEALATGLPTVTSNVSAMPEVAGDAALLIDPMDERGMVEALTTVLIDETVRHTLARRGPERARDFTWERTAALTVAAYEAAMRRPVSGIQGASL